jgi:hypothetical protein
MWSDRNLPVFEKDMLRQPTFVFFYLMDGNGRLLRNVSKIISEFTTAGLISARL